jgi:hypothetical protein
VSSGGSVGVGGGGTGVAGSISSGGVVGTGGGQGTGGGGSNDCTTLWDDYMRKLEAARTCATDATGQCSPDSILPDACGCPVYVNPTTSDEAQSAYEKYTGSGCINTTPCTAVLCPVPAQQVHCVADSTGARFVCTGG